ncbi:MAG: hypothetical protein LKF87_14575 [Clostridium tyrobutyricum]|uniref:hypothetical protein n=1 Tax=Clostridium tyrobutyricum TaxID=1519 RepID=UPI0011CAF754|nr:hypothetical protein [Clostridium tyrobutyricum]MCH4200653.1 hypothetical protein [Clostridium tyrobutyricum]MCH4237551.1 hypothetical protein [Clostridium tyrobutyricum]MCH4260138.1 hypothetical protein [Clostridium tyrobutyricum]MCI2011752.1 hypothetical protein [Clostridium tyrobutyricum]
MNLDQKIDELLSNSQLRIPISIKDFTEIAFQIIKKDTGVNVSNALKCDVDEETYAIYTKIDANGLKDEDINKLAPYSISEDYLNTEYVLSKLFNLSVKDVSIYTSEIELEAAAKGDNNFLCYMYVKNFKITYKARYTTVSVDDMSDNAKVEFIKFFFYQYYNTDQDVQDFASEFYFIVNEIIDNNLPVTLNNMSDWKNSKDPSGLSFNDLIRKYDLLKQ